MREDVSPGVMGENKRSGDWSKGNDALTPLSDNRTINLIQPQPATKARSKATRSLRPAFDFVIGRLQSGQPVSEQDVFDNSNSRYRRSESLMILREVHRRYPQRTALVLRRDGMWVLIPVRRRP